MPVTKRIVCLANSRKLQGRCVAGRELVRGKPGAWIRPVSNRPTEEVYEQERCYAHGGDPQLLDIIEIRLQCACPHLYQQENWLIDSGTRWTKLGSLPPRRLHELVDTCESLWVNGWGSNDRIPENEAALRRDSLKLIHVRDLKFVTYSTTNEFGTTKLNVRGVFTFNGVSYNCGVTDPVIEEFAKQDLKALSGRKSCHLTMSLGVPFKGYVYKLIAAVIGST